MNTPEPDQQDGEDGRNDADPGRRYVESLLAPREPVEEFLAECLKDRPPTFGRSRPPTHWERRN